MCRGFSFSLHPLKAWNFRCDISFYKRRVNFQTKAKSNNRLTFIFEGGFVEQSCGFLRRVNAVSALLIFSSHRGKGEKSPLFPFCVNNSRLLRAKDLDHSGGDEWLYVTILRTFFRPRHVSNSSYGKRLLLVWLFQGSFHVIFRLANDIYTAIHIMR